MMVYRLFVYEFIKVSLNEMVFGRLIYLFIDLVFGVLDFEI